jgi:predicted nucleic acid-binding protein
VTFWDTSALIPLIIDEPGSQSARALAARLLRRHPLCAADALQLGAAMTWAGGRPAGHRFASHDERLATTARAEGFKLVVPR